MSITVDRLQKWLDSGADIAAVDERGNSRLHRAIIDNDPETVALLLRFGANPCLENNKGLSSIHLAKHLNCPACRELLQINNDFFFTIQKEGIKNNYLTKIEIEAFFSFEYLHFLQFPYAKTMETICYITSQIIDPYTREKSLGWGARFSDKINSGFLANLYLSPLKNSKDYALFSNEHLSKGQYIGEYVGKICKKENNNFSSSEIRYTSDPEKKDFFVINNEQQGNLLRFAKKNENPNMQMVTAHVNDLIHIIFIAQCDISPGEQLFYN